MKLLSCLLFLCLVCVSGYGSSWDSALQELENIESYMNELERSMSDLQKQIESLQAISNADKQTIASLKERLQKESRLLSEQKQLYEELTKVSKKQETAFNDLEKSLTISKRLNIATATASLILIIALLVK